METRSSTHEPHAPGSPNGADVAAATFDAPAPAVARLCAVDELPLSAEDCALGEIIGGKYLIEGVIGRGSMGVVVRATHLGFDELVALKFIRPEMRKRDGIVSRFAREAKASVRIRNEHAVKVLDVGVADPLGPYFVMEYLEGINLEELVDSQGAFDVATAVKYLLEACEALAAAHAQGIIHRDIKPQNLFLAWQGRLELLKVLDFGISKAAFSGQVFGDDLSSTETDWVMGTPLYMSPEQLRHAPDIDERTDIWSLGAVLYELLCGQPLFSGETQTQICRQVLEVSQRPVRLPIAGVPEELWDVIERCLSLDKEERYGNVAELGEALLPFAPPGAVLHVERARALLGLRPLDLFDPEDEIEDIDVEPLDEPADEDEAASQVVAVPAPRRLPIMRSWADLAVPVLSCAVLWLGVRQCQMDERMATLAAPETQVLALRPAAHEAPGAATRAPGAVVARPSRAKAPRAGAPAASPQPDAPASPPVRGDAPAAPPATPPAAASADAPSPATPSSATPSPATPSSATPSSAAPSPAAPSPATPSPAAAMPPAATSIAQAAPTSGTPSDSATSPGGATANRQPTPSSAPAPAATASAPDLPALPAAARPAPALPAAAQPGAQSAPVPAATLPAPTQPPPERAASAQPATPEATPSLPPQPPAPAVLAPPRVEFRLIEDFPHADVTSPRR